MSAGYIQLAAIGQQDVYLTGEPQVTYFSGVYKRHTPFVLEAYDIPFNGQTVTYGSTAICRIPPKGDLVRGLTLKMTLPALYNPGTDWTWPVAPTSSNRPVLWVGLRNGTTVGPIRATYSPYYYTTNVQYHYWFTPFTNQLFTVQYISATNYFQFSNVSNVIVQSVPSGTTGLPPAYTGVFWGFDPLNYTSSDATGNLIYNADASGTLTPDFTLQQAGWIQPVGILPNPLTGLYLTLTQPYPLSGLQFLNFSATSSSSAYWNLYDTQSTAYTVTAGGCLRILQVGYYLVRLGFNLGTGSIATVSYGTGTVDGAPAGTPTFAFTYSYTVSPDPSTPTVIPINVTNTGLYYYFYVTTNGVQALPGTYVTVYPAADFYYMTSNISGIGPTSATTTLPLTSNISTPENGTMTFNPSNSTFSFGTNGEYLVTGVLSLSGASQEPYVSNVSLREGANLVYTYDMSIQGRNPTFAFSIPVVANTARNYFLTVASTSVSNVVAGSYFTFEQVGVLSDTTASIILPYNGALYQAKNVTLTSPLNLSTNFVSNTNSNIISLDPNGALKFNNVMTYMLTGVFYTSSPVTSVSIAGQTFPLSLGIAPPYTISVPFRITDTTQSYPVTVTTQTSPATVDSNSYVSVSCLASSNLASKVGTIYNYNDSVGTLAIVTADLKVGGQTIQSLTGEYIELWNELNVPYENQPGLQLLTGKYDINTSVGPPGRTYYVNLPFYFYGNPELSLPIVALDRQDVEVWVTFNNFSNLTSYTITSPTLQATIITEYVYLSNPEIAWFQNHRLDYVITQCQYDQFLLSQGFTNGVFKLNFKHPVKEIFFVIQPDGNAPYDYSNNGLASLGLTYNGEDAFLASAINALYLGSIEPFNHHGNFGSVPPYSTVPGRQFYMYAFSTEPSNVVSSGCINFSRIRQVLLEMNMFNSSGFYPPKTMNVTAVNQNVLRVENGVAGIMFS
jgi:Large eukaryotic DNA virus major capsid protein/Major capsid protein N-terminus